MEVISAPIPGENYTSDTKNYPWHRPPEFEDLQEALDYTFKKVTDRETSASMMMLAKNEVPLTAIAQMYLMGGIMRGKWTVDYALLMAGPLVNTLSLMAKAGGIKHTLGIEDKPLEYTDAFFSKMKELDASEQQGSDMMGSMLSDSLSEDDLEAQGDGLEEGGIPSTGFAGMAAQGDPSAPMDPSMGDPNAPISAPEIEQPM